MTLVPNPADTAVVVPGAPLGRFGRLPDRFRRLLQRLAGGRGTATSDVFRHMLVLAAGSGAAKAISLFITPIITRLYTPDQYGLYVLFMASIALLTPLATLRYSAALPLPRRNGTAVALLLACLVLLTLFTVLLAALFATFSEPLFGLLSAQALAPFWPLLVAAIAIAGLYEILTNWSVRKRDFRVMAKAEVSQSVLGGILKIGFALAALHRVGLLIGHIVAQAAACLLLMHVTWRDTGNLARRVRSRTVRLAIARYAAFPAYRMPSQMLLNFGQQAPVFFVSAIYGAATAGQLGLALGVLAMPLMLLGQTTGQAYYAEIARIGRSEPERIYQITREVTVRLLALGLVPTLVLMLAGTWLFPLFFGASWHDAGVFSSILAIYLLAQFVANPLSHALNVFDKQHIFLRLNVVRLTMIVGIFAIAHQLKLSAFMAIAAYSVVLSIHYVMTSIAIFATIRRIIADRRDAR